MATKVNPIIGSDFDDDSFFHLVKFSVIFQMNISNLKYFSVRFIYELKFLVVVVVVVRCLFDGIWNCPTVELSSLLPFEVLNFSCAFN